MDKHTTQLMFSSDSDEWVTPDNFYNGLDNIYHFTLDPATDGWNSKCKRYFTAQQDGLKQSWQGETVFVNPPYSDIKEWVRKSYEEGQKPNTCVVMLIPSRTDTKYWHDYIMKAQEIHFVKGRLKFGNQKNCAPFPSAVIVFHKDMPFAPTAPAFYSMGRYLT